MRFVNYCIPFLFTICTVSQFFGIGFVYPSPFSILFLLSLSIKVIKGHKFTAVFLKMFMAVQNDFYCSACQNPWCCVSVQNATLMANSPSSCQMFCKETPRSLEQQLQVHRYYGLLRFPWTSNPLSLKHALLGCAGFKGLVHPTMKNESMFYSP